MNGYTILIIEDDHAIGSMLQEVLKGEGYQALWITDGQRALKEVKNSDMIIIDIMLPGENGYEISEKLKENGYSLPILFLTARSDIDSKLKGLSLGEDYLVKPFDPRELLARIQLILKNKYGLFTQIQNIYVDAVSYRVFKQSIHSEIKLTATERKLFFYLYENRDRILTREQIFNYLWPLEYSKNSVLNVHIKKIREKISDKNNDIIETVHGEGYRLNTLNYV
ncbi:MULTISPECIES: response regulator transcription factor [unclassified Bacillus cereus group]|uniref:response regulator transcription factor n=1 Tax=unclassified Bacillus cereus group TaxID=2750818 RepID=UPI001F5658D3|nr:MULTISPECIES: response regulator transcription factor [unclassified Bacillus cereus group]